MRVVLGIWLILLGILNRREIRVSIWARLDLLRIMRVGLRIGRAVLGLEMRVHE